MNMELINTHTNVEKTDEERRRTAEDIHAAISHSLSQLLEHDGVADDHSSVVELRQHQVIALRALRQFGGEDSLVQAA